jgi:integrase/recombinase XerD
VVLADGGWRRCDTRGIAQLAQRTSVPRRRFVKHLQGEFSPPTVQSNTWPLRMLFDWRVTGHVLSVNPAHAVRGPKIRRQEVGGGTKTCLSN